MECLYDLLVPGSKIAKVRPITSKIKEPEQLFVIVTIAIFPEFGKKIKRQTPYIDSGEQNAKKKTQSKNSRENIWGKSQAKKNRNQGAKSPHPGQI